MKRLLSKLKKLFRKSSQSLPAGRQGFTLIELLVVIGILGILATALVATIDPFEQLKKGQDANAKNALVEYLNANVRYFTTHNAYTWDTTANGGGGCNGGAGTAPDGSVAIDNATLATCTDVLVNDKELKSGFATATSLTKQIFVTFSAANSALTGCFRPQSTSQRRDKATIYDKTGIAVTTPTTNCEGYGGTIQCFWCTK